MAESNENQAETEPEFRGLLASYETPDALVEACDEARRAGYKKMDAFSPFPIHGIDDAIGIKRTKLPVIVFCVGMSACLIGLFLQWYTNGFHHLGLFPGYDFMISGKPMFSLPANIPVTFEIIVLLSAFTAFFGMWALNGLPKFSNPLFRNENFRRATSDGFFLYIETGDGSFNEDRTGEELSGWGAQSVEKIYEPQEELHVPGYFRLGILIVFSLILVPPVVIFRAQFTKNPLPRMHVNPDMDRQHRGEAQDVSPKLNDELLFADNRVMRKDPAGTIARGELGRLTDSEFYEGIKQGSAADPSNVALVGYTPKQEGASQDSAQGTAQVPPEPEWITEFPTQIKRVLSNSDAGQEFYRRGQKRFDVYCSTCHGYSGYGNGLVNKRASALTILQKGEWIQAKSLHDPVVVNNPVGRIFNTISNGRGGMGPYRSQITAQDRWAIVFFVKSLQYSRQGEKSDIPAGVLPQSWAQVDPTVDPFAAKDDQGKDDSKTKSNNEVKTSDESGKSDSSKKENSSSETGK